MEPDVKIIEHDSYTEIVCSISESGEVTQFKNLSTKVFFDMLGLPLCHVYSEYFKKRLHQLCIQGVVRPEQFSFDLNSGEKTMAQRGYLKCLKSYKIKHDHIDSYYDSFIVNFNNYLKRNKIKLEHGQVGSVMSSFLRSYGAKRTGHWVIYKELEDKRVYLDICEHDADTYLMNVGIFEYKKEYPHIFVENA
ncbi:hypothetical protein Q3053_003273 [Vibrio cholerae]|nr:hypothetical protein [Vibrio cholerae]